VLWVMMFLVAIVLSGGFVRRAASRARAELAARRRVHISIRIAGEGMASREELRERAVIENEIHRRRIGEVSESGSGGGYMDVVIAVADAEAGELQLRELLAATGYLDRAEIKTL
jgi:hypothetical protein